MSFQELYLRYCNAVALVEIQRADGSIGCGTAFHIGEGVFVTARHVVEGNKILSIETTTRGYHRDFRGGNEEYDGRKYKQYEREKGQLVSGPHFSSIGDADVAILVVQGIDAPRIKLSLDSYDYLFVDEEVILSEVLIMGYPPIPFSDGPRMVASRAEVNTVIDKYIGGAPYFLISSTARGGFSGGPCLGVDGKALGLVTESLVKNNQPEENGFMAVLTVKPIIWCLVENKLVPRSLESRVSQVFLNWKRRS